jgi:hypothetical protein
VATELSARLSGIFLRAADGRRACHGSDARYASDPHWQDLVLFHEYFHGDDGRGVGASHQTGWTALVVRCLETVARAREHGTSSAPAGRASAWNDKGRFPARSAHTRSYTR